MIETFHLDVEGGVGERRTTPAANSAAATEIPGHPHHLQDHQHGTEEGGSRPSVQVHIGPEAKSSDTIGERKTVDAVMSPPPEEEKEKKGILKKPKKRVGFQVSRPDVLDF